jgi:hypothetical protein
MIDLWNTHLTALYIGNSKGYVDVFLGNLTFATQHHKHFLGDEILQDA